MKVAVVCSNGKVGKSVVAESLAAGFEVTGFARGDNKSQAKSFVQKDIFALTKEDLSGFDVVVDAFGAWTEADLPNHGKSLAHLCDILSGTKTRLIIVGGAGSLYVNGGHTVRSKGESVISYADYAAALVEEIKTGRNIQKRISVVRE